MERSNQEKLALRHLITRRLHYWIKKLQLEEWLIEVEFGQISGDSTYGACAALSAYRKAKLYFDLDKTPGYEDVDQLVVHELMHILTMPLHEHAAIGLETDAEAALDMAAERVVHDLSVRIVRMVAGKRYPKVLFAKGGGNESPAGRNTGRRKPRRRA